MTDLHFEYKYVYGLGLIRVDDKRPDLLAEKLDVNYIGETDDTDR